MKRHSLISMLLILAGFLLNLVLPAFAASVNEADIREAVSQHVQEALLNYIPAQSDVQASVSIGRVPIVPKSATPSKKISIRVESSLTKMYSERMVAKVTISDEQGQTQMLGVPVQLVIQKLVWVARQTVPAKSSLSTRDFTLQSKDVSRQFSYAVGRECNLEEYVARVNIQAGEMLDNRKIVRPPDITRNTEVNILLSNPNGMTLSVTGIALSDGKVGQTIRVKQNVFSTRYYNARVIDKHRVQVDI